MSYSEMSYTMSTYHYEQKDVARRGKQLNQPPPRGKISNQIFKDVKVGILKIPTLKIKNRCNYEKLKHYLKQLSQRLNTEIIAKADLILKYRNRVVNHIKKKENCVAMPLVVQIEKQSQLKEAMGKIVTYCDILLHRFSLLQNVKSLDDISAEAVSSLIWASHRLALEELRCVAEQLTNKYGRCYAQACQKKQVATINEQLVSQISFSTTSKAVIEKILLDIVEEYKIEYIPDNEEPTLSVTRGKNLVSTKDENANEILLDLSNNKCTTDKECELIIDVPLISLGTSPTPSAASQLDIPNIVCSAPSPEGSCLATSPGGTKRCCHSDISPGNVNTENSSPIPSAESHLNIPIVGCHAPSPGGSCIAASPGGTKIWCNFDISPVKFNTNYDTPLDPHNIMHQSISPFPDEVGTSRNNPFLDDLQGFNLSNKDVETLKDIATPSFKISNPFRTMLFQDDSKPAHTFQHDLFQVNSPDDPTTWKTKTVEPDLLFEMDIEDNTVIN